MRRQLIAEGEKNLGYEYKNIPLSAYAAFRATGDRKKAENAIREKRTAVTGLVLAELVENKERFIEKIVDGIWSICEETTWCHSAHFPKTDEGGLLADLVSDRTVDLLAAETAQFLAIIYDLMKEPLGKISPRIGKWVIDKINEMAISPFLTRDFWWMGNQDRGPGKEIGLNNWTPWCCRNLLQAALLISEPHEYEKVLNKAVRCVDEFLKGYGEDGGCEEGRLYWYHAAGQVMGFIELIFSDDSEVYKNIKIRNMGSYIRAMRISGNQYVNFSDSSATGGGVPSVIYNYGKKIGDESLMDEGAYLHKHGGKNLYGGGDMALLLQELMLYDEIQKRESMPTFEKNTYFSSIEVFIARSTAESGKGLFVAAKGGHNASSHNHNDVGNISVYKNGMPVLIDVGAGTYTRKTFSDERYKIWTMQSSFHNLPEINGFMQKAGRRFAAKDAFSTYGKETLFSMDISEAYPSEAGVKKWIRVVSLSDEVAQVSDEFTLLKPGRITLNYMVAAQPEIEGNTFLINNCKIILSGAEFTLLTEKILLDDQRLKAVWGDYIWRVKAEFDTDKSGKVKMIIA